MEARMLCALAAASGLLVVTGCAAAPASPTPPTAAEVRAFNQHLLDLTRTANHLDEPSVPRLTTAAVSRTDASSPVESLLDCLTAGGDEAAISYGDDIGYLLAGNESGDSPLRERLTLYQCVADHPLDPLDSGSLVSESERAYLWNYWNGWVIPCLRSSGHVISRMPSRAEFVGGSDPVRISPYSLVPVPGSAAHDDGAAAYLAPLVDRCGPPFGAIARLDGPVTVG